MFCPTLMFNKRFGDDLGNVKLWWALSALGNGVCGLGYIRAKPDGLYEVYCTILYYSYCTIRCMLFIDSSFVTPYTVLPYIRHDVSQDGMDSKGS